MRHEIRFTLEKISHRLIEIEGLVYQQHEPIPLFISLELDRPDLSLNEIKSHEQGWTPAPPGSYWIQPRKNFALKTFFSIHPKYFSITSSIIDINSLSFQ